MSFSVVGGDNSVVSHLKPTPGLGNDNNLSKDISDISFDKDIPAEKPEKLENFDHLSHIDPDDEWLQMETGSIAESISSVRK